MSADLFWLWAWFSALAICGAAILLVLAWRDQQRREREIRRRRDVLDLAGYEFGRRERR